jgi:hypothetical protein
MDSRKEEALKYLNERKAYWSVYDKSSIRKYRMLHEINNMEKALIMKNKLTEAELRIVKSCFIDIFPSKTEFRIIYK